MAGYDRDIATLTEIIDKLRPKAGDGDADALKTMLNLMEERRKLEDARDRYRDWG
jgi:hypothetical protein